MKKPIVLCFSGADPSGGAGIQADIEAIASMGCHAATIITALTAQNSQGVKSFQTTDIDYLHTQADLLLADMQIDAIKTGMLATSAAVDAIIKIIITQPNIPLVVDPVMSGNIGGGLSHAGYAQTLSKSLLPLATIVTPNIPELYKLAPQGHVAAKENNLAEACKKISSSGCQYVLVTGAHEDDPNNNQEVVNRLFKNGELIDKQTWPRLPGEYHGSGCTLASSLAALLAKKIDIVEAVHAAQDYTWRSLNAGQALGKGQQHPDRFFWAKGS